MTRRRPAARSRTPLSSSRTGTGLGLSTVLGIVEQAGGTAQVSTEPGRGSTFVVTLPRAIGAAVPAPDRTPLAGVGDGQGQCALVVEDNPMLRSLLSVVLEGGGYAVEVADDGARALERVRTGLRPALVVSDLRMPTMGGRELRDRLAEEAPESRILLVGGYAPDESSAALDGVAFLQKPFSPSGLLTRVSQLLAG